MLVGLMNAIGATSEMMDGTFSNAERAGAAIGVGIGTMMILSIWAFGDLVLGLFVLLTRPSKNA